MKKKRVQWLFLFYSIVCHLPYIIPALNRIEPKLAGVPFTVYSAFLWMLLCCCLLMWLSKNVWDSYDGGEEAGK